MPTFFNYFELCDILDEIGIKHKLYGEYSELIYDGYYDRYYQYDMIEVKEPNKGYYYEIEFLVPYSDLPTLADLLEDKGSKWCELIRKMVKIKQDKMGMVGVNGSTLKCY